ncbi:hypothetical protein IID24_04575 [Patescibacteria group bacterium]|nr:hypothetical protein [Patescibacteria group bacterium]
MPERDIRIGAFFGFLTPEGGVRLQRRTQKGSRAAPGQSYEGDWELPGGGSELPLEKALTLEGLDGEARRETREELGFVPTHRIVFSHLYRAVLVNEEQGFEDWAFVLPVPPHIWNPDAQMKRDVVDVGPKELRELALRPRGNQLLSGWGKRMCRLSLGTIVASSPDGIYKAQAATMLDEIRPDWRETEFFEDAEEALAGFRRELGLN